MLFISIFFVLLGGIMSVRFLLGGVYGKTKEEMQRSEYEKVVSGISDEIGQALVDYRSKYVPYSGELKLDDSLLNYLKTRVEWDGCYACHISKVRNYFDSEEVSTLYDENGVSDWDYYAFVSPEYITYGNKKYIIESRVCKYPDADSIFYTGYLKSTYQMLLKYVFPVFALMGAIGLISSCCVMVKLYKNERKEVKGLVKVLPYEVLLLLTGAAAGATGVAFSWLEASNLTDRNFFLQILTGMLPVCLLALCVYILVTITLLRVVKGDFRDRLLLYVIPKKWGKAVWKNIARFSYSTRVGGLLILYILLGALLVRIYEPNQLKEVVWILLFIVYFGVAFAGGIYLAANIQRIDEKLKTAGNIKLTEKQPPEPRKYYGIFADMVQNINELNIRLETSVYEQVKSERMKTELITNVSHDIKTPLTSIINYVDLLKKEACDNGKIKEYVAVLDRQSLRLKKLIADLIDASKITTGNVKVELAQCELNVLVAQLVGEYQERLEQKNITSVVTMPKEPVYAMADGNHLARCIDNLMSNVSKYALEGTRFYIDVSCEEENINIIFKNISREPLNMEPDELMERFVRGDASRNTEGNGLGLSIAESLLKLQGGKMQLDIDGDLFKVTVSVPKWKAAS